MLLRCHTAYGQTGSGKTHTLIGAVGDPKERGVVPRAVAALAGMIAQDTSGATFEVRPIARLTLASLFRDCCICEILQPIIQHHG